MAKGPDLLALLEDVLLHFRSKRKLYVDERAIIGKPSNVERMKEKEIPPG